MLHIQEHPLAMCFAVTILPSIIVTSKLHMDTATKPQVQEPQGTEAQTFSTKWKTSQHIKQLYTMVMCDSY